MYPNRPPTVERREEAVSRSWLCNVSSCDAEHARPLPRALRAGRARGRGGRGALLAALAVALLLPATLAAPPARAEGRCGSHSWCDTALSPQARAGLLLGA